MKWIRIESLATLHAQFVEYDRKEAAIHSIDVRAR